ncbi:lambda-exonuclease family protein [Vibrio breoganii]
MAIVDYVQRSDAWFEWRKQGITASMIPVIMGLSAYQTPYELWAEMVGLKEPADLSNSFHVQRGVEQEPEARDAVEAEYGRPYMPVCVEADHNPLFKASLDGLYKTSSEQEVLEIKCPCEKIYNEILELKGQAPTFLMYASQVQWQLNCTGAPQGRLYFYLRGKRPISTTIRRNDSFIKQAEEAALTFWNLVQTKTPPPLIDGRDKVVYDLDELDNSWEQKVKVYKQQSKVLSELELKVKEAKAEIKQLEQYFTSQIPEDVQTFDKDGIRATRVDRKGSVDYKKLIAEIEDQLNVVIPPEMINTHTKKGTTYFRVSAVEPTEQEVSAQEEPVAPSAEVQQEPIQPTPPESVPGLVKPEVQNEPEAEVVITQPRQAQSYFEKSSSNVFF